MREYKLVLFGMVNWLDSRASVGIVFGHMTPVRSSFTRWDNQSKSQLFHNSVQVLYESKGEYL